MAIEIKESKKKNHLISDGKRDIAVTVKNLHIVYRG